MVAGAARRPGRRGRVATCRSAPSEADKFYAQAAIDAGCAFVNALPVFIASDPVWAQKFTDAGLPIVGDDIKSQVGATIVHRALAKLFEDRGVELLRTYQLNFGGNMDFMNMLERNRLVSKKISKTQSVTSQIPHEMAKGDVHIGPSDHVPWLDDRKWAYIRLEGRSFGDIPLNAELKLEVWDSPNSAGVIIDAVRAAKIALDRGIGGPILSASRYFMKSPPVQYTDHDAHEAVEAFIARRRRALTPTRDQAVATLVSRLITSRTRGRPRGAASVGRSARLRSMRDTRLQLQQAPLAGQAAAEADQLAAGADDPVARHDDRQRVAVAGRRRPPAPRAEASPHAPTAICAVACASRRTGSGDSSPRPPARSRCPGAPTAAASKSVSSPAKYSRSCRPRRVQARIGAGRLDRRRRAEARPRRPRHRRPRWTSSPIGEPATHQRTPPFVRSTTVDTTAPSSARR